MADSERIRGQGQGGVTSAAGRGERLVGLLSDLGYPGPAPLPEHTERLFEGDAEQSMTFLLGSLSATTGNVLTLEEEGELRSLGSALLEGDELRRAVAAIDGPGTLPEPGRAGYLGEADTATAARARVDSLSREADALRARITAMEAQEREVDAEAARLEDAASAGGDAAAEGGLEEAQGAVARSGAQVDEALAGLQAVAQELRALYCAGEGASPAPGPPAFLMLSGAPDYGAADREYTRELARFHAKQFSDGPARLVREEAAADSRLGWRDPITRAVPGEREAENRARVAELRRLRSIFELSERQWAEAQAERARHRAVLEAAGAVVRQAAREESKLRDKAAQHASRLESSMRGVGSAPGATPQHERARQVAACEHRQAEVASQLEAAAREEADLRGRVVPSLCGELARLQDTYVLEGDYDTKLLRQGYYLERKRRFVGLCAAQHARHRLVAAALELERGHLQHAVNLLAVASRGLAEIRAGQSRRARACEGLRAAGARLAAGVEGIVDSRDTLLRDAVAALVRPGAAAPGGGVGQGGAGGAAATDERAPPPYLALEGVVKDAEEAGRAAGGAGAALRGRIPGEEAALQGRRVAAAERLHRLVWPKGLGGEPQFTSPALASAMSALEGASGELGSAIELVASEHSSRLETLASLAGKLGPQRGAFARFFTDPEELARQVEDLQAKMSGYQPRGLRV